MGDEGGGSYGGKGGHLHVYMTWYLAAPAHRRTSEGKICRDLRESLEERASWCSPCSLVICGHLTIWGTPPFYGNVAILELLGAWDTKLRPIR